MTRRTKTKAARLQAMLSRPSGASLDAICKATGWQRHSVHAALSTLRKSGVTIERREAGKAGATATYHLQPGKGDH